MGSEANNSFPRSKGTTMSIRLAFIAMAADEGIQSAITQLEKIQSSLETLAEVASPTQKVHLAPIARDVDDAIFDILQSNAVAIRKAGDNGVTP